ncbi:hypothetical protein A0M37_01525 [Campylobacter jejuni]|uniref:hypothetical protein n=1 Tax=Campylobacter jejuni TaxID=197 RepID=UPI00069A891E|nr:hypothetical protein [Campylobacter jejuni]EHL4788423.1 hypothetical protein [Campylobacter jejuni]OEW97525.1 hypothetical protein A0M37_01525 [Campylobacter jejuni]OEX03258.1 hypothetical protein A0M41_03695 [Campylobacter jejuni]HEF7281500.1 hypothetical protein [Campylobacter jejuni]
MNFKTLSLLLFFVNFFIACSDDSMLSCDDTQVLDFLEQEEKGQIYQDIMQNLKYTNRVNLDYFSIEPELSEATQEALQEFVNSVDISYSFFIAESIDEKTKKSVCSAVETLRFPRESEKLFKLSIQDLENAFNSKMKLQEENDAIYQANILRSYKPDSEDYNKLKLSFKEIFDEKKVKLTHEFEEKKQKVQRLKFPDKIERNIRYNVTKTLDNHVLINRIK